MSRKRWKFLDYRGLDAVVVCIAVLSIVGFLTAGIIMVRNSTGSHQQNKQTIVMDKNTNPAMKPDNRRP